LGVHSWDWVRFSLFFLAPDLAAFPNRRQSSFRADFRIALLREKERCIQRRDTPILSGKPFDKSACERLIIKLIGV